MTNIGSLLLRGFPPAGSGVSPNFRISRYFLRRSGIRYDAFLLRAATVVRGLRSFAAAGRGAFRVLLWRAGVGGGWLLALLVATGLFIADCYALCWIGLWKGLTANSSTRAFAETISRVLVLP